MPADWCTFEFKLLVWSLIWIPEYQQQNKNQTTTKYPPSSVADPSLPSLGLSRYSHQTFTPNLLVLKHRFCILFRPRSRWLICIPPPCSFIINLQVERRGEAVEQRGGGRRGGGSLPLSALDLLSKSDFSPISAALCAVCQCTNLLLPYL